MRYHLLASLVLLAAACAPEAEILAPTEALSPTDEPSPTDTPAPTHTPTPTITNTPTITMTPTITNTPTVTPTETPTLTAYEISRTATAEYQGLLSLYVLVEKRDFLEHPWEYEGQLVALRGEVYDIVEDGWQIELWVDSGATYDFVQIYLAAQLTSEDDYHEGYQYYVYGVVEADDTWTIGYGISDAFLGKQAPPPTSSLKPGHIIQRADGRLFQLQADGTWVEVPMYVSKDASGECPPGFHLRSGSKPPGKECERDGY